MLFLSLLWTRLQNFSGWAAKNAEKNDFGSEKA